MSNLETIFVKGKPVRCIATCHPVVYGKKYVIVEGRKEGGKFWHTLKNEQGVYKEMLHEDLISWLMLAEEQGNLIGNTQGPGHGSKRDSATPGGRKNWDLTLAINQVNDN